jgi:large subunit ribosomal protein L18
MYKQIRLRRRQGVTNYKKRIALLKGGLPRVVIRKSNRGVMAQVVNYDPKGDKVTFQVRSNELKGMGWSPRCNLPTAYLTGLLLSKKSKSVKGDLVADTGLYRPMASSVIFAAIKGCIDGGMKIRAEIKIDEKRISGAQIGAYATSIKGTEKAKKQFSGYAEEKFDPEKITEMFNSTKKKILSNE